jgi:hypothetical protein
LPRKLAALKAYGLLDGRSDLRITDLAKRVTYGTGEQKPKAILEAFLNIPLWKQLYEQYRLQLPSEEFWAKLQHITGCEAPVAKSNEQFITRAFGEDTSLIKSVKEYMPEDRELTPPDQESSEGGQPLKTPQIIEVKAGPYYQRLPFTEQGKKIAIDFLNALETEPKKPKKEV